jgi:hypothetical protein
MVKTIRVLGDGRACFEAIYLIHSMIVLIFVTVIQNRHSAFGNLPYRASQCGTGLTQATNEEV